MLTFYATDISGNETQLTNPVSVIINIDEDAPADDLTAVFPFIKNLNELDTIKVLHNGKTVFVGPVDEQSAVEDADGCYTRIVARSMAAYLLDNESRPVSYTKPSSSVIFSRHLKPNGIKAYRGENIVLKSKLNIPKGTTDWQAFAAFCLNSTGKIPRVGADGTAYFYGIENDKTLYFSNSDGIKYISLKENILRCNTISDVYIKLNDVEGYALDISSKEAKARGISRRRFLDATGSGSPMTADKMLANSRKKSYEVTIAAPVIILDALGASVKIDSKLNLPDNLVVKSVYFSLSQKGTYTSLKLKKGD